jgi:hypothetical protein
MQRSLKPTRSWDVSVSRNAHEFTQATPSHVTPESRNDILGVDRGEYPEPTFFRHGLNVRRPDESAIGQSLMGARTKVSKNYTNRAARMNVDIHEICGDQAFVLLAHSLCYTKEVKVRVTLHVQVDRNSADL